MRLPCDGGTPSLGQGELSDRPLWGEGSKRLPALSCGACVKDMVDGKEKQVSEPFAERQTIDSGGEGCSTVMAHSRLIRSTAALPAFPSLYDEQ